MRQSDGPGKWTLCGKKALTVVLLTAGKDGSVSQRQLCSHAASPTISMCIVISRSGNAFHTVWPEALLPCPVHGHRRNDCRWAFAEVTLLRLPVWICVLNSRPALFAMLVVSEAGMMYLNPTCTLKIRKVRTGALCTYCTDPWTTPCSMLLCIDSAAAGANTCRGSVGVERASS